MKNDFKLFEIKVDLDKTLEYNFQPFFQRTDGNQQISSEKNLQNPGLVHKNYTDSLSKLLINADDNNIDNQKYGKIKL
jgi:hypothetical protein